MKIFGLKFVVSLGTLVQDGLAYICGVRWQAVPAKFKIGMCEMAILGLRFCGVFLQYWFRMAWHTYVVLFVPSYAGKVRNRDV